MGRKGISGVLTVVLLISVFSGAYGAPAAVKLRSLMAEGEGKGKPKMGQGSPSPSPVPLLKGNPPNNSSSNTSKPGQSPTDSGKSGLKSPKGTPVLGTPSIPAPASGSPPNPALASGSPPNPALASGSPSNPAPASGSPSNPTPASGSPSNPVPPSPLNPAPSSGSPLNPVRGGPVNKPLPLDPNSGDDGKKKNENNKDNNHPSGSGDSQGKIQENEKCNSSASLDTCRDEGKLFACLQHPQIESQKLFLLVHNGGENPVTVNVVVPPTSKIDLETFQLSKDDSKKIDVTRDSASSNLRIVLNAGHGDCILEIQPPISVENFLQQLPNYASRMTPIYGVYVLFLTVVIAGGTWACCKFGKNRRGRADAGIPYQQLEMGIQQQSTPVVNDTVDGWDQGWADDWDEEEAVSGPPDRRAGGNVSENGIASRSSDKNGEDKIGWEDWDDD